MSEARDKSIAVVNKCAQHKMLDKLITQIQKDLLRAGVVHNFFNLSEENLFDALKSILNMLITDKRDSLYAFLYAVDVSEASIRAIVEHNAMIEVEQLTYLILKREYMKIAYREGLL